MKTTYPRTYLLNQISPRLWQATTAGSSIVGAGSRPELAIRDWKNQTRLRSKN